MCARSQFQPAAEIRRRATEIRRVLETPTIRPIIASMLEWLQATPVAEAISQSLLLNAALSSVHLLGITLLVGSVLVSSLRLIGVAFVDWPAAEVTRTTRSGTLLGLAVTVGTGLFLVSPRAVNAAGNSFFQTKLALLAAALILSFTFFRHASATTAERRRAPVVGMVTLLLWLGVVVSGAAFILLE
jgi:uncharacterized membrane protein SirB2